MRVVALMMVGKHVHATKHVWVLTLRMLEKEESSAEFVRGSTHRRWTAAAQ
jgi:hypothetical protein